MELSESQIFNIEERNLKYNWFASVRYYLWNRMKKKESKINELNFLNLDAVFLE